jgi:protein PhnA
MEQLPKCPECGSEYTYEDGELYVCPECGHEWSKVAAEAEADAAVIRDANGTPLADGDTVTVIKDLKLKGASSDIKVGTKVKGIKLNFDSDHNLDCKIPGVGAIGLKSEFVKKV